MSIKNDLKIGILGGSFDPPHKGHLQISKISLRKVGLKRIYWCITKKNPFKDKSFYSIKERKFKSKKVLGKFKKIKLLYLDDKIKSSRTIDLVNYFIKKEKLKNLYLLMGSDNLINFHKWKSWKKVIKVVKLVVFSRRGYDKLGKKSVVVKYINKKNIIFINNKFIDLSSTSIKNKVKQNN